MFLRVISLTEVFGMAESKISLMLVGQKSWELYQDFSLSDWNAEDEELWQQMETLSLKCCEMAPQEVHLSLVILALATVYTCPKVHCLIRCRDGHYLPSLISMSSGCVSVSLNVLVFLLPHTNSLWRDPALLTVVNNTAVIPPRNDSLAIWKAFFSSNCTISPFHSDWSNTDISPWIMYLQL